MKTKPTPPPPSPPPPKSLNHFAILIGIAIFWFVLLILTFETHMRTASRLMPIVGILFVIYAGVWTIVLLRKRRNNINRN